MASQVSISQREEQALARMTAAIQRIGEAHELGQVDLSPTSKHEAIAAVARLEQLADFLEQVAKAARGAQEFIGGAKKDIAGLRKELGKVKKEFADHQEQAAQVQSQLDGMQKAETERRAVLTGKKLAKV